MAKPEMGIKRQCQACGAKFFDMNREKIVCPKCGTPFAVTVARAPSRAPAAVADDEEKETDAGAEIVPLEDADAADDALPADDDSDVADDDAGNTFLEEEEEDGHDVSGLIDGEIETDEEP